MDHSRAQHVTHRLPWSRDRRLRVADRAIDRGTLESVRECQTLKVRARSCRGETMLKLFFMDMTSHRHHRPGRRGPRAARVRASTERGRRFAVARSCVRRRVSPAGYRRGSTGVPCSAKRPARARACGRAWGHGRGIGARVGSAVAAQPRRASRLAGGRHRGRRAGPPARATTNVPEPRVYHASADLRRATRRTVHAARPAP